MAKPIPDGFNTVSAHLVIQDAAKAIEFYKKAFGAEEICRMPGPGGHGIMHAEIKIGNSMIMMCDEFPNMCRSPHTIGGSPVTIHMYVTDADKVWKQAVDAGAEIIMPIADQFWGDRYGKLKDPFGHEWSIATHVEDLSPEQMAQKAAEAFANCPGMGE